MQIRGTIENLAGWSGKGKILNIILVIATLIIAPNIYRSKSRGVESLNARKETETKKNQALSRISQLEKKIKLYEERLSKKDASLVMNTINSLARDANIKIISIKPGGEEKEEFYTKYPFVLAVSADSYHAVGKFISRIENHSDLHFVDYINIRIQDTSRILSAEPQEEDKPKTRLIVNLTLSLIVFKG